MGCVGSTFRALWREVEPLRTWAIANLQDSRANIKHGLGTKREHVNYGL